MQKIILCILLFSSTIAFASQRKSQLGVLWGQDNPDESSTRTTNATLVRFSASNKGSVFRFVGAFTYLTAGGEDTQGEFTIGPHIYPFANVGRIPVQPFFMVEGAFGVGTIEDKVRYDTGFGVGVGADFNFFAKGGLTLMIEQHNATESAHRTWVGFFYRN